MLFLLHDFWNGFNDFATKNVALKYGCFIRISSRTSEGKTV